MWTDDEVELLLRVTLDYKRQRWEQGEDWEACPSKYSDIMDAFQDQYPRPPTDLDFPHHVTAITKAQVTAKVKNIRGKYRRAVHTGRRRGQGRAVLLFFGLCEQIWAGPPVARCVDAGVETGDLEGSSSVDLSPDSPHSVESVHGLRPAAGRQRGLQAQLSSRRGNRLKRKLPAEEDLLTKRRKLHPDPAEEDLLMKRRMLELMEESSRRSAAHLQQINTNIANITHTIQEGFSLMRMLLLQPHPSAPHGGSGGSGRFPGPPPPQDAPQQPAEIKVELTEEDVTTPGDLTF